MDKTNKSILIKVKIIVLLVAVLVSGFGMISINANSAAINLTTNKTVVNHGDKVSIVARAIDVSNIRGGFNGFSGTLKYDTKVVSRNETTATISGWTLAYNAANNKFVGSDPTGMDFKTQDVDIVLFEFNVLESAPVGKTVISLADLKVSDANYKAINLANSEVELIIEDKKEDTKPDKSSNNKLADLKPSVGNLSPKFDSNTKNYTLEVDSDTNSISFESKLADANATIVSSNKTHNLVEGKNTIDIVVRAEDGSENTYTVVVNRAKNNNDNQKPDDKDDQNGNNNQKPNNNNDSNSNKDSNITINNNNESSNNIVLDVEGLGHLNEQFNPHKYKYQSYVGREVTTLNPIIVLEDKNAKYELVGVDKLKIGENIVKLVVTAENGEVREYEFLVNRSEEENTSTLASLSVGGYALNPGFRPDVNYYTLVVSSETTSLGVSAAPAFGGATVNISGNDKLNPGVNLIKVSVDSDYFQNTYLVEVIKESETNKFGLLPWIIASISLLFIVVLLVVIYFKNKLINQASRDNRDYDSLLVYLMNQNSQQNQKQVRSNYEE